MGPTAPNLFLVGAPKAGTTAMYEYLRAHPDVFFPERKEPHHFGRDIRSPRFVDDRAEYLRLYAAAGAAPVRGDASVWYLRSLHAAEEIAAFAPKARILVMLRDPVELVRSLHEHNLAIGIEDEPDLGRALGMGGARAAHRRLGRPAIPEFLDYLPVGRFADQLERFQRRFPPEQLHVIVYEEFARDVPGTYRRLLEWLGIEPGFRPRFRRVNAARRSRNATLSRLLHAPPPELQRVLRAVVPVAVRRRVWHDAVRPALTRANTADRGPCGLAPELRERLRAEYAHDVRRTAELLHRPDLPGLWGFDAHPPAGQRSAISDQMSASV